MSSYTDEQVEEMEQREENDMSKLKDNRILYQRYNYLERMGTKMKGYCYYEPPKAHFVLYTKINDILIPKIESFRPETDCSDTCHNFDGRGGSCHHYKYFRVFSQPEFKVGDVVVHFTTKGEETCIVRGIRNDMIELDAGEYHRNYFRHATPEEAEQEIRKDEENENEN